MLRTPAAAGPPARAEDRVRQHAHQRHRCGVAVEGERVLQRALQPDRHLGGVRDRGRVADQDDGRPGRRGLAEEFRRNRAGDGGSRPPGSRPRDRSRPGPRRSSGPEPDRSGRRSRLGELFAEVEGDRVAVAPPDHEHPASQRQHARHLGDPRVLDRAEDRGLLDRRQRLGIRRTVDPPLALPRSAAPAGAHAPRRSPRSPGCGTGGSSSPGSRPRGRRAPRHGRSPGRRGSRAAWRRPAAPAA